MHDTPPSVPDFTQWPSFPFEGDLRVKQLDDPVPVEPPRKGEGLRECTACNAPDDAYIWVGERWRVRAMDRPTGLPMVLILESRTHLDLGDLPNLLAAELGVMTVRLERAIRSLDGVARVHVNRWGDGSAHLHMWFLARPYGRLQLRGTFLSLWDSILPPISEEQWRENLALVAAWLAEFGGRPLAEPPRIQWQAPSSLLAQSAAAAAHAAAAAQEEAVSVIEAAEEIPEPAVEGVVGTDPAGLDAADLDAVDLDAAGPDAADSDAPDSDAAGPDAAGLDAAGPDVPDGDADGRPRTPAGDTDPAATPSGGLGESATDAMSASTASTRSDAPAAEPVATSAPEDTGDPADDKPGPVIPSPRSAPTIATEEGRTPPDVRAPR
ncbi:hypothetical protein ACGFIE_04535 [Micromonospora sp. NPDC049275]|uniref:hypothetical protein n=1 Tax=Micromonospora sp. NPDC049275 TaxID=3364268 RepID=UPI003715E784